MKTVQLGKIIEVPPISKIQNKNDVRISWRSFQLKINDHSIIMYVIECVDACISISGEEKMEGEESRNYQRRG